MPIRLSTIATAAVAADCEYTDISNCEDDGIY
jgi:hypothetical protein